MSVKTKQNLTVRLEWKRKITSSVCLAKMPKKKKKRKLKISHPSELSLLDMFYSSGCTVLRAIAKLTVKQIGLDTFKCYCISR